MNRSKIVAIITGAISIILAIAYLILVQLLDYRDMQPAPISQLNSAPVIAIYQWQIDKTTQI
ncbi:glucose-inhibited division protein A [Nostoc minutum NIES-26]|uniref:Glucose-inhibited division protein A n=1 Tax=Nostoc minutum NIES-26 TaxID=1844469 RepID=A0A367Q2C7_9NOSO|nr:glucose-inhibited division protein A [Nostoc minutum NIES-26]